MKLYIVLSQGSNSEGHDSSFSLHINKAEAINCFNAIKADLIQMAEEGGWEVTETENEFEIVSSNDWLIYEDVQLIEYEI